MTKPTTASKPVVQLPDIIPPIILPPFGSIATLNQISPQSCPVGIDRLTVTITGSGFQQNIVASALPLISGSAPVALATTFISSTTLMAVLPRNLIQSTSILQITAQNLNGPVSSPINLS